MSSVSIFSFDPCYLYIYYLGYFLQTAKSYLQEVEKELSQESTKDSTVKKVMAQRKAESPEATTKSARKRQRKKLKSNKQSCSPQLDPDTSKKAAVKKDCSLDQTIAGTIPTEPANDGQVIYCDTVLFPFIFAVLCWLA